MAFTFRYLYYTQVHIIIFSLLFSSNGAASLVACGAAPRENQECVIRELDEMALMQAFAIQQRSDQTDSSFDEPSLFQKSVELKEPPVGEEEDPASVTLPLLPEMLSETVPATLPKLLLTREGPENAASSLSFVGMRVRSNSTKGPANATTVVQEKGTSSTSSTLLTSIYDNMANLAAPTPNAVVTTSSETKEKSDQRWMWAVFAVALVLLLVMALVTILMCLAIRRSSYKDRAEESEVLDDVLMSLGRRKRSPRFSPRRKARNPPSSSGALTPSERSSRSIEAEGQQSSVASYQVPGLPLCHLLVVPQGTRLACVVQNDVRRRKQELSFDINAIPARGGAPLFRMRVSELTPDAEPGISVQTVGDKEQLAFLSTQELWQGKKKPVLTFLRPWGLSYGTFQQGENGEYLAMRGSTTLLCFTGDFQNHNIKVLNAKGHRIATTEQLSMEEYQVHMSARSDAGLVALCLVAIDKLELLDEGSRGDLQAEASR